MNSVGIFGGTFDPIHLGHLIAAQSVKEIRKLEKVIFVPSRISPFKTRKKVADKKHRLKMLKLAIGSIPYFDFSDIELKSDSVSFTVDTLEKLSKKNKKMELIIGMDNLSGFKKWKSPDRILELSKLIVLRRKIDGNIVKDKYYKSAIFVETPVIEISAEKIRERVRKNLSIDFFVPKEIAKYINQHNLYKTQSSKKGE